jgi:hypothetical protein
MKFLILSCLVLSSVLSVGQVDTSFVFSRKGVTEEFQLKKYAKPSQIKRYPVYAIEKSEVGDLQKLITYFVTEEAELKLLKENRQQVATLYESKIAAFESSQKIQEARIQNFDSAYNEMKKINGQLNSQLKNCEELAIKEHKRKKRPSLFGILGGLAAGVVVGVLIN